MLILGEKMSINELRSQLQDYAKDIKLNLSNVLSEEGAPGLTQKQILATALACAYATKQPVLIAAIKTEALDVLSAEDLHAAKAAATIMAMNNIYYRFTHMVSDAQFGKMPANLRMNVMANPGVEKKDFELYSLAVSAINGCGLCIDMHVKMLLKEGLSAVAVQSAIRIAATLHATAQALVIDPAE